MAKQIARKKTQTHPTHNAACLKTKFGKIPAYTFAIKANDIIALHYVAVRGQDQEAGAVQRPLNIRRINGIRSYILDGNTFFNSFIINWTDKNYSPVYKDGNINFPIIPHAAQVIDGQHRIAGLEAAIEVNEEVGEQELLVTMCVGLSTAEAAQIFLNINTEQKPVPKSLVFDLFGEVVDDSEHGVNRATDLARDLNEDPSSPLYNLIKFPGAARGQGNIELSTFVTALKDHLHPKSGTFYIYRLRDFDKQKASIWNFFQAIRDYYTEAKAWGATSKNPFLKAAGFNGAIDFFTESLVKRCAENGSFSIPTMKSFIGLDREGLVTWDDLKGKDGKTARKVIKDLLESNLLNSLPSHDEYKF